MDNTLPQATSELPVVLDSIGIDGLHCSSGHISSDSRARFHRPLCFVKPLNLRRAILFRPGSHRLFRTADLSALQLSSSSLGIPPDFLEQILLLTSFPSAFALREPTEAPQSDPPSVPIPSAVPNCGSLGPSAVLLVSVDSTGLPRADLSSNLVSIDFCASRSHRGSRGRSSFRADSIGCSELRISRSFSCAPRLCGFHRTSWSRPFF